MMLMLAHMQLQNFIMHFVIILNVRSQENVLLYLFRNTFDNSWVNAGAAPANFEGRC